MAIQEYEYVHGSLVHEEWADREEVPVPPQWVREEMYKGGMPEDFKYASLAKELHGEYHEDFLRISELVMTNFEAFRYYGKHVLLIGEPGTRKSYSTAALVNELKLWKGSNGTAQLPLDIVWLNASYDVARVLDKRYFRDAVYFQERAKYLDADLLVVDDLFFVANRPEAKEFMFSLYDYRHKKRLPMITTANALSLDHITETFSKEFTRRIEDRSADLRMRIF